MTLKFQDLGDEDLSLMVYNDASFGGSQGAHNKFLVSTSNGVVSPKCWNSKRVRTVRNIITAEILAMADSIDKCVYLASLYTEILIGQTKQILLPLICVTDCRSL